MRPWFSPFLRVFAAVLIAMMLFARPLIGLTHPINAYPNDLLDRHETLAFVTTYLLFAAAVLLPATVVWRNARALYGITTVLTIVLIAAVAMLRFTVTENGDVSGVYPGLMTALAFALLGLGLAPDAAPKPPLETGEHVDGKRHGRWYVYGPDNRVCEIRDYDHGELVSSRPYEPK